MGYVKRIIVALLFLLVLGGVGYYAVLLAPGGVKSEPIIFASDPTATPKPTVTTNNSAPIAGEAKTGITNAPQPVKQSFGTTIGTGELVAAINAYRVSHGLSTLELSSYLCNEAAKRVGDMVAMNAGREPGNFILNHDGMAADVESGRLERGHKYGENIASAYCKRPSDGQSVDITTGTQLVEWCFDSSPGHRENLLSTDWTKVCSVGQFPFYVQTFSN